MKRLYNLRSIVSIILMAFCLTTFAQTRDYTSDATITSTIKGKYAEDANINPLNIAVNTSQGVVKLDGHVNTDAQFERAVLLAADTNGVKDVNANNLTIVNSTHSVSDTLITAKIKGLLLRNHFVPDEALTNNVTDSWNVHVETTNGSVYFSGAIKNKREEKQIIDLARSIAGVKNVQANFTYDRG